MWFFYESADAYNFLIESSRDEGEPLTFTIGVGKLKLLTFRLYSVISNL